MSIDDEIKEAEEAIRILESEEPQIFIGNVTFKEYKRLSAIRDAKLERDRIAIQKKKIISRRVAGCR